jgi:hypothetical protein
MFVEEEKNGVVLCCNANFFLCNTIICLIGSERRCAKICGREAVFEKVEEFY